MTNLRNYWKPLAVLAITIVSVVLLASWDFKNAGSPFTDNGDQQKTDTVPKKKDNRDKQVRDLDDVLDELDNAQIQIDKELKLDMEKLKKELEAAFKNIDMDKIKLDIERGMKEIDFNKIQIEIENSLAKIDMDKIKLELDKLKEIDFSKIEAEMKKMEVEMKKIGPEIEKSMEKIKEIDLSKMEAEMKKVEEEMKKIGPEIEKSMEKAKVEIEKAREEMKEYKNFVDGLEKDGLIDKKKEYVIKHADGELFINGKKQPAEVYNKYRSFLEKHKSFKIDKSEDDFNIDID